VTGGASALAVLAAAVLAWSPRDTPRRRRLDPFLTRRARPEARRGREPRAARWHVGEVGRRRLLAAAAGIAAGLLVGGVVGLAVAAGGAVVGERLLRAHAPDEGREVRLALRRDLPGACELLAVCLAAGLPAGGALAAVATAVPGPLGARLRGVAGLYRLGAEPRRAWAAEPPELAALGRVLARAAEGGSAAAPALRALAADARAASRADTEAAVRRAGVGVLAPLGLCFLPAFVCLGVVPLVLGIVEDVFG
jgi:pilus assembly protein TadC